MEFLLFLLIGYGITTIITNGAIFEPLRDYLNTGEAELRHNFYGILIQCPMCVGFWIGMFQSYTLFSPVDFYIFTDDNISTIKYFSECILQPIFDGSLLSGIAWTIHSIISTLDRLYDYTLKIEKIEEIKLSNEERKNQKILTD